MGNPYFKFKQFTVLQDKTAMKVGVDGVLLGAWVKVEDVKRVLDIGTGTGLLSLMLAQRTNAIIEAIEIEENAFEQAKSNFGMSKWAERISVHHLPLQKYIVNKKKQFDFIICNPPYFSNSLNSFDKERNLARHNDSLTLEDLFRAVDILLSSDGQFCVIYPFESKKDLLDKAADLNLFPSRILNVKGNERKEPNRVLVEFKRVAKDFREECLVIRSVATNDYSDSYKKLTRDFYLKF